MHLTSKPKQNIRGMLVLCLTALPIKLNVNVNVNILFDR